MAWIIEICRESENGPYCNEVIACSERPQTLEDFWNNRKDFPEYEDVIDWRIYQIKTIVD